MKTVAQIALSHKKIVVLFYSKLQLATQCLALQTIDLAMPAALASGERRGRAATQAGPLRRLVPRIRCPGGCAASLKEIEVSRHNTCRIM